ncbi:Triacylglycerol lipase 2, partial [Mucuna pruriens]
MLNAYTETLGPNCCVNSSRIDVLLNHEPQPTATKNLIHLSQSKSISKQHFYCVTKCHLFLKYFFYVFPIRLQMMIRTGKIAKYDYGDQGQNMQHYGQPVPPLYDMTAISNEFPLFLSYGGQDMLSDVRDVKVLLNDLEDHDENKLVVLFKEDYSHFDFVMGVNVKQMIYDPMMAFFKIMVLFR